MWVAMSIHLKIFITCATQIKEKSETPHIVKYVNSKVDSRVDNVMQFCELRICDKINFKIFKSKSTKHVLGRIEFL